VKSIRFKCFIYMLQVFHVDVAKVDQDVAYVAMVIHICCKHLFLMFQLFQTYDAHVYLGVAYVSHLCCKCFIQMLHRLHTYVASVSSRCCICFAIATHVFYTYVASVSTIFGHILQMFPLDVTK
jgi:hypothetical protein